MDGIELWIFHLNFRVKKNERIIFNKNTLLKHLLPPKEIIKEIT